MKHIGRHGSYPIVLLLMLASACVAEVGSEEDYDYDAYGDADGGEGDETVGVQAEAITGPSSRVQFSRGLVSLEFQSGGECSGFFVGPNMIVTAAHCVYRRTTSRAHDGIFRGMKWGYTNVRVTYRPSSSEFMCLSESCDTLSAAGGSAFIRTPNYAPMVAWWDNGYSGSPNHENDFAVITLRNGGSFSTRGRTPGATARALATADYLRILGVSLPVPSGRRGGDGEWYGTALGYGATANGVFRSEPRAGLLLVDQWTDGEIRGQYRGTSIPYGGDGICRGDSGGPLTFQGDNVFGRTYAAGTASTGQMRNEDDCVIQGRRQVWVRLSSKKWMLDRILEWSGRNGCRTYTTDELPGNGRYFRCW